MYKDFSRKQDWVNCTNACPTFCSPTPYLCPNHSAHYKNGIFTDHLPNKNYEDYKKSENPIRTKNYTQNILHYKESEILHYG